MSTDYVNGIPAHKCHGVGDFGRDCVYVFVQDRGDVQPKDGFLAKYVEWCRTGRQT